MSQNHLPSITQRELDRRPSSLSSPSSSSSNPFPRPDEGPPGSGTSKLGPNWIDPFAGMSISPARGGFEVKKEEGRIVVTYKGAFRTRTPSNDVTIFPIPSKRAKRVDDDSSSLPPLLPTIERYVARLNLSDSSSHPPPQFPFPWAAAAAADSGSSSSTGTDGCVKILSVDEITSKLGIREIRGEVECSKCHKKITIGFDLKTESMEIGKYVIFKMVGGFFCPDQWLNPKLPPCPHCYRDARQSQPPNSSSSTYFYLKPVIPENGIDYKKINWLFLFLSEMLGCCSVEQLNFFCKHSSTSDCDYRRFSGAKDRLLYLAYVTLCKHLYPTGSFDP